MNIKMIGKISLLIFCASYCVNVRAQIYGPEQIPQGNFGTVYTEGKNGDNNTGTNIYPTISGIGSTIPFYYQPAKQVYHNGNLVYIDVNPGVTIGHPLIRRTSYTWGMNEQWTTNSYYFPRTTGTNSNQIVPHAPNNGYYLVATATNGMYNLPTLNAHAWYEIYDKYETDTSNPTNYFLITNADTDPTKIFYYEKVGVTPGQAYRMSVDLSRLNTTGVAPNIDFIITPNFNQLTTTTPTYNTGSLPDNGGNWTTYYFDYVAPCNTGDSIYVAFRNRQAGGNGNDVALDNLSMKAIYPQITAQLNGCNEVSFAMLDQAIVGVFPSPRFQFQWQIKSGADFQDIAGETNVQTNITVPGIYRLAVFTTATAGCPMYTNQIEIVQDGGTGCLNFPHPTAHNDIYNDIFSDIQTGNVLANDVTSNPGVISHDSLSVINFTVNGVVYAAGATAVVNSGTTKVGVMTVNSDGNFIFSAVSGFTGQVPDIQYTIKENNGGQSSAIIRIRYITYTFYLDASCVSCPVEFLFVSPDLDVANNYEIYKGDSLVAVGRVSNDSLDFRFYEKESGILNYTFVADGLRVITFPVLVSPDRATWAPNLILQQNDWSNNLNWQSETGSGFPQWCTDVVIPGNVPFYPNVGTYVDFDQCRDITFMDSASVGRIHNLFYRKAFVEISPKRDRWMMLSAPLKYTYSADYSADPTWGTTAGIDPPIYMRYFDMNYSADTVSSKPNPDGTKGISTGNFSRAFANLKERLKLGDGFALKVGQGNNSVFNGTLKFPRLNADTTEVLFKYHYRNTGEWIEDGDTRVDTKYYPFRFTDSGQPGRGTGEIPSDSLWQALRRDGDGSYQPRGSDNRYRFAFENGATPGTFTITVDSTGTTNIVGNPFMSHLDFDKFYNDNSTRIQPYYRIWDGTSFHSYMIGGGTDNNVWRGLPPIESGAVIQATRYLAPMQSFFVEMRVGNNQLVFNPDSISIAVSDSTSNNRLKSADENEIANLLKIRLKMASIQNMAIVAALPSASDNYNADEDIFKLFSYDVATPEIYTITEGRAIEINALSTAGNSKVIPVGIKTDKTGNLTIDIEGINNFMAYPYLYFTDAVNNKTYDLRKTATLTFEKTTSDNSEGRFYLVMQTEPLDVKEVRNDSFVNIIINDGVVSVSSPLHEIENIMLYDISGRIIYRKDAINSLYYSFNPGINQGIFILKIKTPAKQRTFKIQF